MFYKITYRKGLEPITTTIKGTDFMDALTKFHNKCIEEDETGIFFDIDSADIDYLSTHPLFYQIGDVGICLESEPQKYQTKKTLYGECLGSIYIGLIHEFSGIITDAELLSDFCEQLWSAFYDGSGLQDELFIGFDEYGFWMSNNGLDPMLMNPRWYRVYTDGDQYCDLIEPIEDFD